MEFEAFPKIPRIEKLSARAVITEKLDGTNAQIAINDVGEMFVGSRNRWLKPEAIAGHGADNYGFAAWCHDNREELLKLGQGRHYGEWYGRGIGRGYGLQDRRFALFNTMHWGAHNPPPACCEVVTVLADDELASIQQHVQYWLGSLASYGSHHVPDYMHPEGLVVYLSGTHQMFKAILDKRGPSPIQLLRAQGEATDAAVQSELRELNIVLGYTCSAASSEQ